MTVADLIAHLERCDPAAEVRFAYQPNYPLWATVGGVAASDDFPEVFLLQDADGENGYAEAELWEMAL